MPVYTSRPMDKTGQIIALLLAPCLWLVVIFDLSVENVVSTKDLHLVISYKTFAAVQALRHVSLDMYSKHPTLGYPFIL